TEVGSALAVHGAEASLSWSTRTATLTSHTFAARATGTWTATSVRLTFTSPCWVTGSAPTGPARPTIPAPANAAAATTFARLDRLLGDDRGAADRQGSVPVTWAGVERAGDEDRTRTVSLGTRAAGLGRDR